MGTLYNWRGVVLVLYRFNFHTCFCQMCTLGAEKGVPPFSDPVAQASHRGMVTDKSRFSRQEAFQDVQDTLFPAKSSVYSSPS